MFNVLVVSAFEGGYQPNTALSAYTAVASSGLANATFRDTYVDGIEDDAFDGQDLIALSSPLFDSLRASTELARRIRERNPKAKIVHFGQYATLNAARLASKYGDYAVVGEWEKPLTNLVRSLVEGSELDRTGLVDAEAAAKQLVPHPYLARKSIRVADRSVAPPLEKYPQPHIARLLGVEKPIVGGVEATRGCHHKCTYCSVFAAYGGKVIVVEDEVVLQEVRNLVAMGMTHLSFTDAEFFNAKKQALRIVRALHDEFPDLTYDFTTRVDHILDNVETLKEMKELGVKFITSALEFPTQRVLDVVAKEITVADIDRAIAILREIGIRLNPTFIMYNPWVTKEDIDSFKEFVARNDLEDWIEPIQYETRLHLYKGSPLLSRASTDGLDLTEEEFHFDWKHPHPEVDEMYLANVTPPEEGVFKRCCLKC